MKSRKVIFATLLVITCLAGCATRCKCPKEDSYTVAMQMLRYHDASSIFDRIEKCNDAVALRIIAFTARVAAWPMEAGPNAKFDNRMDDIFQAAMHRLFAIDSNEARETIEYYKHAFPSDGAYSLFLKGCEEERSKQKHAP